MSVALRRQGVGAVMAIAKTSSEIQRQAKHPRRLRLSKSQGGVTVLFAGKSTQTPPTQKHQNANYHENEGAQRCIRLGEATGRDESRPYGNGVGRKFRYASEPPPSLREYASLVRRGGRRSLTGWFEHSRRGAFVLAWTNYPANPKTPKHPLSRKIRELSDTSNLARRPGVMNLAPTGTGWDANFATLLNHLPRCASTPPW
jgi:threonine dehydrogenase-like Zn-dependent dehydrogenase